MRHMYVACRRNRIPIGVAPNIEVSLIVNPDDAQYLVPRTLGFRLDRLKLAIIKRLAAVQVPARAAAAPGEGHARAAGAARAAEPRSGMIRGRRLRRPIRGSARSSTSFTRGRRSSPGTRPGPDSTSVARTRCGACRTARGSRRSRRTERPRRVPLQGQPGAVLGRPVLLRGRDAEAWRRSRRSLGTVVDFALSGFDPDAPPEGDPEDRSRTPCRGERRAGAR